MKLDENRLRKLIREAITNAYEILGVDHKASPDVINKAYRQLAFKQHPDRVGVDNTNSMVKLNIARDVLLDPSKRRVLDAELGVNDEPTRDDLDSFLSWVKTKRKREYNLDQ